MGLDQTIGQAANYVGAGIAAAVALPVVIATGLRVCNGIFSGRKLSTKQQVDEVADRAMLKLGLDRDYVTVNFPEGTEDFARTSYDSAGNPLSAEITLAGPETTESEVRHELYHARRRKDGKFGQGMSIWNYIFMEEPLAIAYGWFGRDFSRAKSLVGK